MIVRLRFAEMHAGSPMVSGSGELNWLLLAPMFFIDAYKSAPSWAKSLITIYIHLANTSTPKLLQADSWKLVCIVPQGDTAFFLTILSKIVVKPMLQLECGQMIYVHVQDGQVKCYGSVFNFIGDHPGQAEMMCIVLLHL
jgi:hypothetical protein